MLKKIFTLARAQGGKLLLASVIFAANVTQAQWQADVRLTNNPAVSNTSYNNEWCIATSGNVVHVVWYDNRDGNKEIYYNRSIDGGSNWGADTRLTNDSFLSSDPSISVSGSVVHVVWYDNRIGNIPEIYYKRSTDVGISWEVDTRLTNNSAFSYNPSISVFGSIVHVVWEDNRDGNYEIYYKRSTDAGVSWGADIRQTISLGNSYKPSLSVSGSVVHVVWYDDRDGNFEIYYKRSTDAGVSWGADTRLTNNFAYSWFSSVAVSGSSGVHVVWEDNRDGNWEIYYKRSTDEGISWGPDTRLTNNSATSSSPSLSISGSSTEGGVHVVWYDFRDGNGEIYYKRSTDAGISWGADIRLTNNPVVSYNPSVSVSGSVVHVIWYDTRDGNPEIYYKRNPTGNLVGINNINSEIPKEFKLEQNYPNPFNPNTIINYELSLQNKGLQPLVLLKVYDVLGNEVASLVNEKQNAGSYSVEFNGANFPSGIYYYKLEAGNFSEVKKMILLK